MKKAIVAIAFLVAIVGVSILFYQSEIKRSNTAELSWDANIEPELAGYFVYWGTAPGDHSNSIDVGLLESRNGRVHYVVTDLPDGEIYFAVSAYDRSGVVSEKSGEVVKNVVPQPVSERNLTYFKQLLFNADPDVQKAER